MSFYYLNLKKPVGWRFFTTPTQMFVVEIQNYFVNQDGSKGVLFREMKGLSDNHLCSYILN